jgi:hypothetical protein
MGIVPATLPASLRPLCLCGPLRKNSFSLFLRFQPSAAKSLFLGQRTPGPARPKSGESVQNLCAGRSCLWTGSSVSAMMSLPFRKFVVSDFTKQTNDVVKAVHQLRQHGIAVGFPMQTADGQIIFSVGKDTLTANQILDLLERGELHAEGVRKSVEAQASARPLRKKAASP